jgi:ABC-2 type transport system ATP-binding protein
MIEIENITKVYPNGHQALNNLNLQISKGMFGLLGPNGAGKTTLMRILATLLRPTKGRIVAFGNDLAISGGRDKTRNLLGYLPQDTGLHPELTVEQELDYIAILKRVANGNERAKQITNALEKVGLLQSRRESVRTLSGGMKRRLGIALTLLGNPRLIIVDEPTAGLDPAERVRFRNLLYELAGDRVVILSTHIVEDVSQICSDLVVLDNGNLFFHGSPTELVRRVDGKVWATSKTVENVSVISLKTTDDGIENRVFSNVPPDSSARLVAPTLEDAYLWLVQQSGKL